MSDEIKPALSPEEWEYEVDPPFSLDDRMRWASDEAQLGMQEGARHALAALALHGQPFGFTHDDVRALCEAAEAEIGLQSCRGGPDTQAESDRLVDSLRSLKTRIAALLPPPPNAP